MNKLYISGYIQDTPQLRQEQGNIPHFVFNLSVQHRTQTGELRRESYRVSAWHKAALWGAANLAKGQLVAIQGYLAQHQLVAGNISATTVEIAVDEFLPLRQPAPADPVIASGAARPGHSAQPPASSALVEGKASSVAAPPEVFSPVSQPDAPLSEPNPAES